MGALAEEDLDAALGRRLGGRRLARGVPRAGRGARAGPGAPGARPRQARQRHGPARQPRPRGGAGARSGPAPRTPTSSRPASGPTSRPPTNPTRASSTSSSSASRGSPRPPAPSSPAITVHAANSAAVFREPGSHFDMARCGVAVYGLDPFQGDPAERGLRPALSLASYVADVKRFAAGDSAGYGQTWKAAAETRVGGSADRLRRRRPPRPLQQRRGAGRAAAATRWWGPSRWTT